MASVPARDNPRLPSALSKMTVGHGPQRTHPRHSLLVSQWPVQEEARGSTGVRVWGPRLILGGRRFNAPQARSTTFSQDTTYTHKSPLVSANKMEQIISSFFLEQYGDISPSTVSSEKVLSQVNHTSLSSGSESKKNLTFFFSCEAL